MDLEDVKGLPFDYSDDKITVYFEIADKLRTEVISFLSQNNIAIYAVIPK